MPFSIIHKNEDGSTSIINVSDKKYLKRATPKRVRVAVIATESLPEDTRFIDAWYPNDEGGISVDIAKAKELAHAKRRAERDAAFAPLDAKIAAAIPGLDVLSLEAQRQKIREDDAAKQNAIDAAETVDKIP